MNNLEKTRKQKTGLSRLLEIAGSKKWWLIASVILAVLATAVQFVPTIIVYRILTELSDHASNIKQLDRKLLYDLGFISLGSIALFGALLYASSMLSHIAAFNILYEIRVKIAEKLTRISMGFFNQKSSGEIKKVMSEDVERIELFVAHHIPDIVSAFLFPIIMLGYLFFIDWQLAIAAIVPLPLAILVQMSMMSKMDLYRDYHRALEKMNGAVVEYVRAMPVIKIFGATAKSFKKLNETVTEYKEFAQKITRDYSTAYPGFLTVASSSLVFIIPAAVFFLSRSDNAGQQIPEVLLFLIVGGGLFFPFLKLMFIGSYLKQITIGVEQVDKILNIEDMYEIGEEETPSGNSLEFDNVSFGYNNDTVLKNISFRVEPNTVTALVGPSGAGKSTIGLLAARFWDPDSGSILIGGTDIKKIKIANLMDYISFVFQDNFLFFDSVKDNIRMGNNTAPYEEFIAAAKAAQCHDFISRLPNDYETPVGEGGTYLSGGEQQRISIARAILKDTPIVILDEATAYADPENEGKILEAFSHLTQNKTVIVIAHRLSTITNVDQILVVDNGEIVQRGVHEELKNQPGLYQKMWDLYSQSRNWVLNSEEGALL